MSCASKVSDFCDVHAADHLVRSCLDTLPAAVFRKVRAFTVTFEDAEGELIASMRGDWERAGWDLEAIGPMRVSSFGGLAR